MSKDSDRLLYCSFCGKDQRSVAKLVAGPSVFICNECIDFCSESTPADLSADDQCSFCAKPNSSVKELYAGLLTNDDRAQLDKEFKACKDALHQILAVVNQTP